MLREEFKRGIITDNPTFSLVLGLCPTLAVSTSLKNGVGMGLSVIFVLTCSNIIISLVKKAIPDRIRIPCFIIVIATFVTMVNLIMKAYFPALNRSLGIFVPLIVVNCIILARAEAFASKNNPIRSFLDGIAIGIGYTISLLIICFIRELLGSNKLWGFNVISGYKPMLVFILAPGGFFTIAAVMGLITFLKNKTKK